MINKFGDPSAEVGRKSTINGQRLSGAVDDALHATGYEQQRQQLVALRQSLQKRQQFEKSRKMPGITAPAETGTNGRGLNSLCTQNVRTV